jgi:nucleoside-diphosphate-sugar epimerase
MSDEMTPIIENEPFAPSGIVLPAQHDRFLISYDDLILLTGATGFIGSRVIERLLDLGFLNVRCLVRPSSDVSKLTAIAQRKEPRARVDVITGNLLSPEACASVTENAALIIHLAAARGEKSFPDAYMNSVVTTRNLIEGALRHGRLRRFVNVSSFAVYDNSATNGVLDENCPVEKRPELRGEAYCFAKVKQDEIVMEYGESARLPYVIVRPGAAYGPGNEGISGRVGIDTFGVFLHLGGSNIIPLTYVDNCADAIVLAGLTPGIDGEVFNVVDDQLPSSRQFLRLYKKKVKGFTSIYLPHFASYALCSFWEWYANWSHEQLPPVFNRRRWYANWKKTRYTNQKLKSRTGWTPRIATPEGMERYFEACRRKGAQLA